MSDPHPTFDSVLDLCRNQHRRIVLGILATEQRPISVTDIAETILKYTHHTPLTEVHEDVITQTRISLQHNHLPKLASQGLISCESDRKHVEATELLEQIQPTVSAVLDADPELEGPIAR